MNEQEVLQILSGVGALIAGSHIVYTSGKHGSGYVNKDAVYPHTQLTSRLCRAIAVRFAGDNVHAVIAPAVGGVTLSQWTAHHLSEMTGRDVLAVYAERAEKSVYRAVRNASVFELVNVPPPGLPRSFGTSLALSADEEVAIKRDWFTIRRGYDKLVDGKNVLVVEDVLTTGGSARKTAEAARMAGGNVIGLGALCNRGGITPGALNVPKIEVLVSIPLEAWDEAECPLCKQGVPVNTDVGKGREFLTRRQAR